MALEILSKIFFVMVIFKWCQGSPFQESNKNLEVSNKVIPKRYALNLQILPEEEVFSGEVAIRVLALESVNIITLNAHKNLTIENSEVIMDSSERKENLNIQNTEKGAETQNFKIFLDAPLHSGTEYLVKIAFSGKLNMDNTDGLFKKTHVDGTTDERKLIVASQFKPNLTSSAFPCFDNPLFKVPFDVTIERPSKFTSLSTMALLRSVDMGKGITKDVFAATPPMATFSLAIFVSNLNSVIYNKPDVQIRIWTVPELLQGVKQNRSEVIYKMLSRLGENLYAKYPLPKLDYVALPSYTEVNVLTSWGVIISSNNDLGSDKTTEELAISLELTNQWIGSLVTPSLWDEDISVSALTRFCAKLNLMNQKSEVFDDWTLGNLYANYYELGNPTPSREGIRRISSETKAEMVYRMLTYTLTEHTFLKALKNLIKKKQYQTFKMDQFWTFLTKQAYMDGTLTNNLSTKEIAASWIAHYRLPFLTVTRNYDENSTTFIQRVFIRKRPQNIVKDDILWIIPIVLVNQNQLNFENTTPIQWMKEKDYNVKNIASSDEFIIINPEEIGPFMVNYDKVNWNMIANFLQTSDRTKIPVKTRAKLIHDALNLAYAGTLDFGTALNVTLYLKDETDHIPWKPFFIMFDHLIRHIDCSRVRRKYEEFVIILCKPLQDHLKVINNRQDVDTKTFVNDVNSVMRRVGDEQMLEEANKAYQKWMDDPKSTYKETVRYFCTIFRYGTTEQWEFGFKILANIKDYPEFERYNLLKTLVGCSADSWKIKKFLNITLFEQNGVFTDDDFKYAVFILTGGADGYTTTFEYLKENWVQLKARLQDKPEVWEQLIYTATNLYKTQDGLNQVTEFYNQHRSEFGTALNTIQKGLEQIKKEVEWTNDNLSILENWLDNFILQNSLQE